MKNDTRNGAVGLAAICIQHALRIQRREIYMIEDPKHRTEMIQQLEKAAHWARKWALVTRDIDEWLDAFGPDHAK